MIFEIQNNIIIIRKLGRKIKLREVNDHQNKLTLEVGSPLKAKYKINSAGMKLIFSEKIKSS